MRTKLLLLCPFTVGLVYGQQSTQRVNVIQPENVKLVNSSHTTYQIDSTKLQLKQNKSAQSKAEQISYYDSYINSLESKKANVLQDSLENLKALNSGWHVFIDEKIATAKSERQNLLSDD